MSDPTVVNVDRPEPKPTNNVTIPMWAVVIGCLAVGALVGIEAEQGGFPSAVNFRKEKVTLTDNAELDRRWLKIVREEVKAAHEKWLGYANELRAFCDETRCHCRRNGMGAAGDAGLPIGAAPAPVK